MKGLVQLIGAALLLVGCYLIHPGLALVCVGAYAVWLGRVA